MKNKKSKLIFVRIIGLITMVTVGYLYLKGSHYSKLAGYFIYMSMACSIIPLPTPPYVIGMGKIFDPWVIALLGAIGNCIAGFFEYYFLTWLFSKTELRQKIETSKLFQRFTYIFNRAAFLSILLTSFSPVPLDPFYLAAILIRYSLSKYLLAIFIGKYLRYYSLALLGDSFQIPDQYLIIMLITLVTVPVIVAFILKRNQARTFKTEKSVI
jgi:membrane protein YqaA with SNARE-associated domain